MQGERLNKRGGYLEWGGAERTNSDQVVFSKSVSERRGAVMVRGYTTQSSMSMSCFDLVLFGCHHESNQEKTQNQKKKKNKGKNNIQNRKPRERKDRTPITSDSTQSAHSKPA